MPRRPLFVLGLSAFAGAMAAAQAGPGLSQYLAVAAGASGIACALLAAVFYRAEGSARPAKAAFTLAMACLTGSAVLGLYTAAWYEQAWPVQALDGVQASVRLQVLDHPEERYYRCYYQCRVTEVAGQPVEPFRIRLSCSEPLTCGPYDTAEAQVKFYRFSSGGQFSQENAQLADGNVLGAYLADFNVFCASSTIWPPGRILAEIRRAIGRGIARLLPDNEAGLVRAVTLGQRTGLSDSCYSDFIQIGASHLMTVSGLHMTALAMLTAVFLKKLPLGIWGRTLFSITLLFPYLCVTGFPVSAIRSCATFSLFLLGQALGRRADGLNSLGGVVLALCLARPFSGGDVGFCLSVTATAGIVTLYRPLMAAFTRPFQNSPLAGRLARPACSAFAVTLAATAFSLPVQIQVFGGISLLNPLATLLLVPVVTALLYISFPLAMLAPFPATVPLARALAFFAGWLARLALWLADKLADIPGGYLSLRGDMGPALIAAAALAALMLISRKLKRPVLAAALMGLVLTGSAAGSGAGVSASVVTVAITGEPDSLCVIVMQDGHGAALSLGGYNSGMAQQILTAHNIRFLDTVFLPRQDLEAREMARELLSARRAQWLLLPAGAYVGKDLEKTGVRIGSVASGLCWQALPALPVQFSAETGQVAFWANGLLVVIETAGASEGVCGLRITGQADSPLLAGATVLVDSEQESREALFQNAQPGRYFLADGQIPLLVHIYPDGSVSAEYGP